MPSTVILGSGIIGLSTAYYLSQLASEPAADTIPAHDRAAAAAASSSASAAAPPPSTPPEKHEIHLVELSPELFASASGKAAGFLARDWFAPAVTPLGELSFDLHRRLAAAHGGRERWGWAESVSYSLDREEDEDASEDDSDDEQDADPDAAPGAASGAVSSRQARARASSDLDWLMSGSSRATLLGDSQTQAKTEAGAAAAHAAAVDADPAAEPTPDTEEHYPRWIRAKRSSMQTISDTTTTGQVDPHRLCAFLLDECRARGVTLHHPARATQVLSDEHADASGTPRTFVRIQYVGASPESAFAGASTPNSRSPPVDLANGHAKPAEGRSTSPSGESPSPPDDARQRPGEQWQSFAAPSADGGEDYVSHESEDAQDNASYTKTVDVACDSIVIAAGCWTPRVYRTLFPNAGRIPRVTALAGHSVVLKSRKWMSAKSKRDHQPQTHLVDVAADSPLASAGKPNGVPSPTSSTSSSASTSGSRTAGRATPPARTRTATSSSTSSVDTDAPFTTSTHLPSTCHAVFTSDRSGYSPEIFSRLTGDVWLGGLNSATIPLPALPTLARPDPGDIQQLLATAEALLGPVAPASVPPQYTAAPHAEEHAPHANGGHRPALELQRAALCFRPVTPTGRPVIARMHEADLGDGVRVPGGVFVATGHGPWGISLGLGTGLVVSEMVLGRETSADVRVLGKWEP